MKCDVNEIRVGIACNVLTGITSRDFKGIPSIQEVECWGEGLKPEVKLLSLKLYRVSDNYVLASLNIYANTCLTYNDFSSCYVNSVDTHKSRLKALVHDLEEGESRRYGCKATVVQSEGDASELKWSTVVRRRSEYMQPALDFT